MKKRDRAVVAVILAAALVAGLVLVNLGLSRAAQAQAEGLAAAQFNSGGAPGLDEAEAETETETPSSEETDRLAEETAPVSGAETPGETPAQEAQPVSSAAPAAGGGAMTLEQLSRWMQEESGGALAAQSLYQADRALAAGIGSEDDALRRTFAQTQAESNDAARRNQLAEEAASLGLACLKWQELLRLRQESAAFYESLEAMVRAQLQPEEEAAAPAETEPADPSSSPAESGQGREEQVLADLELVQQARTAAEQAVTEAETGRKEAVRALNVALGNPPETELTITDALEPEALPGISEEQAVAQALEQRNEIKAAGYQLEQAERTLEQLRYQYAPNAPETLAQQAVVQEAQAACPKAEGQVETDVRNRLARLEEQAQALEGLQAERSEAGDMPEPAYALAWSEETAGWTSGLRELMERWAELEQVRVSLAEQTAQFNLDVLCLEHAMGVGCTTADI